MHSNAVSITLSFESFGQHQVSLLITSYEVNLRELLTENRLKTNYYFFHDAA